MDPQLVIELAVCADYKIFHSEFLAKSASDRDKAIWWYGRKAETCPACGTRPKEWDEEQGGHRRAYLPEIFQCEGCVAKERTEEAPEMHDGTRGLSVRMRRNPEWE